jgi:hypothetical protein
MPSLVLKGLSNLQLVEVEKGSRWDNMKENEKASPCYFNHTVNSVKHLREFKRHFSFPSFEPSTRTVDADSSVCCRFKYSGYF